MTGSQSIYERIMSRAPGEEFVVPDVLLASNDEGEVGETINEGKEMKARKYTMLVTIGGIAALAVLTTGVLAQQGKISLQGINSWNDEGKSVEVAQADPKTDKPAEAVKKTIFDEHVEKAGVTTCGKLFSVLGAGASAGGTVKVVTRWHDKAPDEGALLSLFGIGFGTSAQASHGAGIVFAAPNGSKCEGASVRVVSVTMDCQSFAKTLPAGSQLADDLQGVALVNLPSGLQTMLIPSQASCVVVTAGGALDTGNKE